MEKKAQLTFHFIKYKLNVFVKYKRNVKNYGCLEVFLASA